MKLDAGLAVLVGCMCGFLLCRVDFVDPCFLWVRWIIPFLGLVLVLVHEIVSDVWLAMLGVSHVVD